MEEVMEEEKEEEGRGVREEEEEVGYQWLDSAPLILPIELVGEK